MSSIGVQGRGRASPPTPVPLAISGHLLCTYCSLGILLVVSLVMLSPHSPLGKKWSPLRPQVKNSRCSRETRYQSRGFCADVSDAEGLGFSIIPLGLCDHIPEEVAHAFVTACHMPPPLGVRPGSANSFYKKPDSKYFKVCGPHDLCSNNSAVLLTQGRSCRQ